MSELKIDSEKVKQAAEKCPQGREILETLFPEVFQTKLILQLGGVYSIKDSLCDAGVKVLVYHPEQDRFFLTNPSTGRHWGVSHPTAEELFEKELKGYEVCYLGQFDEVFERVI